MSFFRRSPVQWGSTRRSVVSLFHPYHTLPFFGNSLPNLSGREWNGPCSAPPCSPRPSRSRSPESAHGRGAASRCRAAWWRARAGEMNQHPAHIQHVVIGQTTQRDRPEKQTTDLIGAIDSVRCCSHLDIILRSEWRAGLVTGFRTW